MKKLITGLAVGVVLVFGTVATAYAGGSHDKHDDHNGDTTCTSDIKDHRNDDKHKDKDKNCTPEMTVCQYNSQILATNKACVPPTPETPPVDTTPTPSTQNTPNASTVTTTQTVPVTTTDDMPVWQGK